MKEIISAIIILATVLGGGAALKSFHDTVKKAALEKAAQGMPSLVEIHRALKGPERKRKSGKNLLPQISVKK